MTADHAGCFAGSWATMATSGALQSVAVLPRRASNGAEALFSELQDRFRGALVAAADQLEAAQTAGMEKLKLDLPDPYEPAKPEIEAEAPDPLYSTDDDWREATEKLIADRDLGDGAL